MGHKRGPVAAEQLEQHRKAVAMVALEDTPGELLADAIAVPAAAAAAAVEDAAAGKDLFVLEVDKARFVDRKAAVGNRWHNLAEERNA